VEAWPRRRAAATVAAARQGSVAAWSWGKREREARRFFSPPYLGQWRREEAAPRWPAGLGGYGGGGGAGSSVRGCAVVEVAVELGGKVEGPFIGGGGVASRRAALMAVGAGAASWSGGAIRGGPGRRDGSGRS